jgi:hypothetical protein
VNPLALGAHTGVLLITLLLWLVGVVPGLAALPLAGVVTVALIAAIVVGRIRHSTGRHHQATGLTGYLYRLLWPGEPGRHQRKGDQ